MVGTLILFPRHHRARCRDDCAGCHLCDGGLFTCTTCGGAEASLPSCCPGRRMSYGLQNPVQAGVMDYDRRRGWVLRSGM